MVKAKKQYGQNFLIDKSVLTKIIQAIPKETDNIVEIGPGLGDLTQELLKISQVKAYEIDSDLIPILKKKFHKELECGKLNLVNQDASEAFVPTLDEKPYFLVANLPYYIASRIILQALEDKNCLGLIVMVQKQMAEKFCAEEGNSDFSSLSVLSAMICERKLLFDVDPQCFNPSPKVVSSVMSLIKIKDFDDLCEIEGFKNFLKDCFKAPRKQILGNLKTHKNEVLEVLSTLGLKENIRPHEICVDSYLKIYNKLKDEYG
ncbi:16S rRNA (adenine(1518)-N(6)/adenine(1519)-N(6))-dimethyltransferase RsmA [Campylobacter sp. VicNov18]|uniref:16S rRNA (adenine(1518)-N(6)/adenine(1519)-N(6))- dimethyltransferase RsmA n=1 Tax=Campylobacter bilis TaxID=2691918 RepID=UPI00130D5998|nr:16S rRNA (adenine(1518)-N(6)/adenine(1519)-N(6))-dimethyltransferase RsmA [Campylobacter bilis]MPV64188.1 16S rRNA (adenine(1518)-N(6)/adenine(1519)-N(6))-dimethyltransferase RsmA [Campylobacter hepaticus]MBM0637692.1 16S rRNA (adenine(1518)-N(6)/adenine(1519)-N(6))-dimethyltransferase RsmA [Campylobacter bilis]MCC8278417.1 16S rRNA (adenine(1518)-N(6)/adenine(1519)-N(6))-dimethyltransferase RsmA [Campylobacter bilis]MCC8299921.1 16S rRNA (adenine(1518)-N(6)/adenine(1519)-N(6))-dimethyltrans